MHFSFATPIETIYTYHSLRPTDDLHFISIVPIIYATTHRHVLYLCLCCLVLCPHSNCASCIIIIIIDIIIISLIIFIVNVIVVVITIVIIVNKNNNSIIILLLFLLYLLL